MQTLQKRWNSLEAEYTYASKYSLLLQVLKMSLVFGNLWDLLRYLLSHTCFEIRFSIKQCQFR